MYREDLIRSNMVMGHGTTYVKHSIHPPTQCKIYSMSDTLVDMWS